MEVKIMRAFYFGCWDRPGHFLYNHNGKNIGFSNKDLPQDQLDGTLCPDDTRKEGIVKIHYNKGWTATVFWDYSIDHRSGSNSVFLVEGLLDIIEIIGKFKEVFPKIYNRFNFELKE